jgi:hypothetical protein
MDWESSVRVGWRRVEREVDWSRCDWERVWLNWIMRERMG